jgi:hypothetical protein
MYVRMYATKSVIWWSDILAVKLEVTGSILGATTFSE